MPFELIGPFGVNRVFRFAGYLFERIDTWGDELGNLIKFPFAGIPNRGIDADIGGTAAEMAAHGQGDLVVRRASFAVFGSPAVIKGDPFVDKTGCAKAALQPFVGHKGPLYRMEIISAVGLDRLDRFPLHMIGRHEAATHRHPLHQHGAGPADTATARHFGPGQAGLLTDHIDRGFGRMWLKLKILSVNRRFHISSMFT